MECRNDGRNHTMSIAAMLIGFAARRSAARFEKAVSDPNAAQLQLLREFMQRNRDTVYGKENGFGQVNSMEEFRKRVPVVTYDNIEPYIDRMTRGENGILTAQTPVLFAQTSGTTGKPKYIPVTPTCQKG